MSTIRVVGVDNGTIGFNRRGKRKLCSFGIQGAQLLNYKKHHNFLLRIGVRITSGKVYRIKKF